jgi:hypothetical protein
MNVYVNVTFSHCSQSKDEESWMEWMFMQMKHITIVLKVKMNNLEWAEYLCKCYITIVLKVKMKNIEWDECLCKCYICDCCFQS